MGKMIILRKFFNKFSCNRREVGVKYICDSDRITIGMIINIHRDYFIILCRSESLTREFLIQNPAAF